MYATSERHMLRRGACGGPTGPLLRALRAATRARGGPGVSPTLTRQAGSARGCDIILLPHALTHLNESHLEVRVFGACGRDGPAGAQYERVRNRAAHAVRCARIGGFARPRRAPLQDGAGPPFPTLIFCWTTARLVCYSHRSSACFVPFFLLLAIFSRNILFFIHMRIPGEWPVAGAVQRMVRRHTRGFLLPRK
jgi:hypothetical protein